MRVSLRLSRRRKPAIRHRWSRNNQGAWPADMPSAPARTIGLSRQQDASKDRTQRRLSRYALGPADRPGGISRHATRPPGRAGHIPTIPARPPPIHRAQYRHLGSMRRADSMGIGPKSTDRWGPSEDSPPPGSPEAASPAKWRPAAAALPERAWPACGRRRRRRPRGSPRAGPRRRRAARRGRAGASGCASARRQSPSHSLEEPHRRAAGRRARPRCAFADRRRRSS